MGRLRLQTYLTWACRQIGGNVSVIVDTPGNVAQDSVWSVIVAKTLTLQQNPVLTINSNYTGSGVPVPEGVGPMKSAPKLSS